LIATLFNSNETLYTRLDRFTCDIVFVHIV